MNQEERIYDYTTNSDITNPNNEDLTYEEDTQDAILGMELYRSRNPITTTWLTTKYLSYQQLTIHR